ncbi:MAG: PEP/pyruvate-binding domain-containing protein [Dehalococcoidia bacterium]
MSPSALSDNEVYMQVLPLGAPGSDDPTLVGAKAANLSRLAAYYNVPPGFVIPAVPADALPQPSFWPPVIEAYHALAADGHAVAVRSSALDEDSDNASFAGQHATVLGVRGEDEFRAAVLEVLASAVTPAALAYRAAHSLPAADIRMAILVQRLVAAEVSAVVFSQDVVHGDPDEVVINATWGLGEPLVSGEVTPDTVRASALEFDVLRREVADKTLMRVLTPDGLTTLPVPEALRRRPALADAQVAALARLATDLERRMGAPVDIECAFAGGALYLLQCRPITARAV